MATTERIAKYVGVTESSQKGREKTDTFLSADEKTRIETKWSEAKRNDAKNGKKEVEEKREQRRQQIMTIYTHVKQYHRHCRRGLRL